MARDPQLEHCSRQRLCPKRTAVVSHYTEPPEGSTTICTDELGPVVPRTFVPATGWSANRHRIKAPMDYFRGPEKTWVYGALRVRDGKELTRCAASRTSKNYIALLKDIEAANPQGDIFIITDNLSSHNSLETRTWLEEHPRIQQGKRVGCYPCGLTFVRSTDYLGLLCALIWWVWRNSRHVNLSP